MKNSLKKAFSCMKTLFFSFNHLPVQGLCELGPMGLFTFFYFYSNCAQQTHESSGVTGCVCLVWVVHVYLPVLPLALPFGIFPILLQLCPCTQLFEPVDQNGGNSFYHIVCL